MLLNSCGVSSALASRRGRLIVYGIREASVGLGTPRFIDSMAQALSRSLPAAATADRWTENMQQVQNVSGPGAAGTTALDD